VSLQSIALVISTHLRGGIFDSISLNILLFHGFTADSLSCDIPVEEFKAILCSTRGSLFLRGLFFISEMVHTAFPFATAANSGKCDTISFRGAILYGNDVTGCLALLPEDEDEDEEDEDEEEWLIFICKMCYVDNI
jgi:hypothetical protein